MRRVVDAGRRSRGEILAGRRRESRIDPGRAAGSLYAITEPEPTDAPQNSLVLVTRGLVSFMPARFEAATARQASCADRQRH